MRIVTQLRQAAIDIADAREVLTDLHRGITGDPVHAMAVAERLGDVLKLVDATRTYLVILDGDDAREGLDELLDRHIV